MSFKENLTNFFYTKEPVQAQPKKEDVMSGSDKYLISRFPCLENTKALDVYKSFVLHAGRCPECNDHLFPEIKVNDDGSYTVFKKCMDRTCNYKLDVSEDFNNHMGIKTPVKDEQGNGEVLVYDSEEEKVELKENKSKLKKGTDIPLAEYKKEQVKIVNPGGVYWSLMAKDNLSNPMAAAPSDVMRELSEAIGECPICHHNEFEINIEYKIKVRRYEAIGICKNCQSVFDVTDFVAVAGYKEFPDILQRDYNLTGWSDCKLRFLRKLHTPRNTGHLKNSVKRALENQDVHGKKESDDEHEYGGKMYIQGWGLKR
ncbi:MAG: hypothetical protein IJF83_03355 [Methanobrevibacter sp.]|nr:hypothetical protein [Methanobrevibacter sp.]